MDLIKDVNNKFEIKASYPEDFREINIYDRWGNLISTSNSVDHIWDGKVNGNNVATGVYIYSIRAYCEETDSEYTFTGDVTVFR
jgi:gliding motility-associated-like protein